MQRCPASLLPGHVLAARGPCTSSSGLPQHRSSLPKPDLHVPMTHPDRTLNPATCLMPPVHEGVEKINAIVELLFTQFEGYVFSVRGPGQSIHGVGRLPWSYGPPDDPQRLTGTDVGVTKDGKLTALYVFIDPPSQK